MRSSVQKFLEQKTGPVYERERKNSKTSRTGMRKTKMKFNGTK